MNDECSYCYSFVVLWAESKGLLYFLYNYSSLGDLIQSHDFKNTLD